MRVKVLIRSTSSVYSLHDSNNDTGSKIEYFNDIDWWEIEEQRILHLYRYTNPKDGTGQFRVATIADWVWVKLDE